MLQKTTLYVIERLVTIFTGLAAFVILARVFGPTQVGSLSIVQAASAALIFLVTLGLDRFIVKSLVETPECSSQIIFTVAIIRFGGWLLYSTGLYVTVLWIGQTPELLIIAAIEAVTVLMVHLISLKCQFEAKGKAKELAFSLIVSRCIGFLYLIISAYYSWSFVMTCIFLPLQSFVRLIYLFFIFVKSKEEHVPPKFSSAWARKHLRLAAPLMLSSAVFPLFMQMDVLMIAHFYGEHEAGLYSGPMKIITQVGFLGVAIMSAFFPVLVEKHESDKSSFDELVSVLGKALFLFSISAAAILLVFSGGIIEVLFGSEYEPAKLVMMILSPIAVFLISSKLYSSLMIIYGVARYELPKALLAVALNIGLNLMLIPAYSINGAAIASLISYFIADFLFYFLVSRLSCVAGVIRASMYSLANPISTATNILKVKF